MLNKDTRSKRYLTAYIQKQRSHSMYTRCEALKIIRATLAISVRRVFSFKRFFLCSACYREIEFSCLAPHLVRFCILFLSLRNSRIQFRTNMRLRRMSAEEMHILIQLFPLRVKRRKKLYLLIVTFLIERNSKTNSFCVKFRVIKLSFFRL
jgi:hypothetical protein